jgi:hypothetical protein
VDIGDVVFIVFIALGALSSVLGGKKKHQQALKKPARRRPPYPPLPSNPSTQQTVSDRTPPRERISPSRRTAVSQMERILRELGLDTTVPATPTPAPTPEPEPELIEGRPPPVIASLESVDIDDEARHLQFHERYMHESTERAWGKPADSSLGMGQTEVGTKSGARPSPHSRPLAKRYLNPDTLRSAILLHEILGPPKGLR